MPSIWSLSREQLLSKNGLLTEADRHEWRADGARRQSRPRLRQSGPLTGSQNYIGRNCTRNQRDSEMLLRPLHKSQHVAHPENPAGQPIRIEGLQRICLLARTHELDRQPRYRANRQCRASAGVAIDLGQYQTAHRDGSVESFGDVHRLLAAHRVDDQERFGGLDGGG